MQYYRLWIYACNVLLGLTSAIFIIFAAFVVADVRLSLLEGVELYHPTFLYAYGALILQCGVVQTIGCLGAKRLSHKLLSLYWTLLLLLTLGDIGVGLYWVFHLEKVKINLRPYLAKEFIEKYSTDESFTIKWNRIQSQDRCCGVDGPFDFEKFSSNHHHHSKQAAFSANSHLIVDVETGLLSLPQSCCTLIYVPTTISSSSSSSTGIDQAYRVSHYPPEEEHPPFSDQSPDASALPHDDYTSDSAGGGRRSRTVINLPHKNDEPRTEVFYDPVGVDEVETDFYVDYAISPQEPTSEPPVVPVDHIQNDHKVNLPDPNYSASELERREIKSHTATHAHKVRHELHRKSQSSSLIGVKLVKNSTVGIGESRNASTAKNVGESSSGSNVVGIINTTESSSATASTIIIRKDETVVRGNAEILHQNESHNKTNKSFPSITVRLQRKERETRALSVTQVPAVSAPIIHRRIDCHGQPEGLNHHSSYKKDLLDQRKTTKDKQGAKTSPNKRVEASWPYPVITRTTSSTTAAAETSTSSSIAIQSKFTFAVSTEKVEANEIEKLTKRQEGESLMATTQPSPGIMTGSVNAALHSSKLTSFSSSGTTRSSTSTSEKMSRRQKRNAEMNVDNSDSTLQSDPFGISQSSAFMSTEEKEREKGSDNLAESYFFPVSSSSAVSSSASFLEANSPHRAILSPSAASHDQWNENNESGSSNNNGNSSVSGIQKRLYVYGQGCGVKLIEWVDHVSGIMFILGFCIIGFVKTCFLVILRTEIREMIEKIHMIEPEEAILSPSRTHSAKEPRFQHVSHPLLQNPHRASTVSAHGVLLPTIKSPDGPSTSGIASGVGGYNRPNRHYLRRASNIVGGDRSRSHSNETVNMTLLMTTPHGESNREKGKSNPNLSSAGGGSGTIPNIEERDPVSGLSIPVPSSSSATTGTTTAPRYLRRSSTCSSSANPVGGYPYGYGFDGEPRAGPSSRFYQYFEPVYQTSHLYQQHHHHHYTRNRPHARNMSCGAILPLTSYRTNSAAAAATALATYRGVRTFNTAASNTVSAGASFSSTSKDENEMIISVSLEHIASSDQDEETVEEEKEQEKKDWAAACTDKSDQAKSDSAKCEEEVGTKLQTFTVSESVNETSGVVGIGERELQRRNGNNNVDLANTLPMSYIGTAV